MATYRIVDMYHKSRAIKGIHYDSHDNPILAYRVDKRHSLLFGLIHYWDYGACNLRPEYLFPSIDKAKEAILKVDKSRRVIIYIPVLNANCKKTFAFLDEYVPPPTRKERRKREREPKKKFPLDLTKFIESHRT